MTFERLNKELEITLKLIRDIQDKNPSEGLPYVSGVEVIECTSELIELGYVTSHRMDTKDEIGISVYRLTIKGRNYWGELRRYRILTYVPLVISGALGMLGAILGVLLGWHLGHL